MAQAPRPRPLKLDDVRSTVATRCPAGHPQVLRCHPLRQGGERFEPFPTLYWLTCPEITYVLSKLEHDGWILKLGERLRTDEAFRAEVERDHQAYSDERWGLLSEDERAEVVRRGLERDLRQRGIGGIRDRTSVKCLHLHYAHHLARGSAIGRALDEVAEIRPCASRPSA